MRADPLRPLWSPTIGRQAALLVIPSALGAAVTVAGVAGTPVQIAVLVAGVVSLGLFVWRSRTAPAMLVLSLLGWLTIERFAVAAASPLLGPEAVKWALAYKEFFFPIVGVVLLRDVADRWAGASTAARVVDGLAVAFLACIALSALLSTAPLWDRLVYARRLGVLPLVYLTVRLGTWDAREVERLIRGVVAAAVAVAAFGFVERFAAESILWRQLVPAAYFYHLSDTAGLSAGSTDFPVAGLPVVFYDFTTGSAARRLVSTFLEATTCASFLAMSALLAWSGPRRRSTLVAAVVVSAATVLTLSKAGIAILAIGMGWLAITKLVRAFRDPWWLASIAWTLVGAMVVIAVALAASGSPTGALAHLDGLREGVVSVVATPLGNGLGVGGNFSQVTTGAESTFGVILVQLGLFPLVVWTAWIIGLALIVGASRGAGALGRTIAIALIGFYATAALTESAGGLLGNWIYGAVAGAFVTAYGRQPRSLADQADGTAEART